MSERSMDTNRGPENRPSVEGLDRVPAVDKIPIPVWIVAIAGAAERFAYYSLSAPMRE